MDIRFRPEPPDAVKGVTPVKDQGADRDKWKRGRKGAEEKGEKDENPQKEAAPTDGEQNGKTKSSGKDSTGRIVDVVI